MCRLARLRGNGPAGLVRAHSAGWHSVSGSNSGVARPTKLPISKSRNALSRASRCGRISCPTSTVDRRLARNTRMDSRAASARYLCSMLDSVATCCTGLLHVAYCSAKVSTCLGFGSRFNHHRQPNHTRPAARRAPNGYNVASSKSRLTLGAADRPTAACAPGHPGHHLSHVITPTSKLKLCWRTPVAEGSWQGHERGLGGAPAIPGCERRRRDLGFRLLQTRPALRARIGRVQAGVGPVGRQALLALLAQGTANRSTYGGVCCALRVACQLP